MLSADWAMHMRNCCVSNWHAAGAGIDGGGGAPAATGCWAWPLPPNMAFEMPWPMTEPATEPAIDEPIMPIIDGACGCACGAIGRAGGGAGAAERLLLRPKPIVNWRIGEG